MSIGRKLYLTYGLMAAFVALMVFGTTRATVGIGRDFEALVDQTLETTWLVEEMRAAGLQIVSSSAEIALLRVGPEDSPPRSQSGGITEEIAAERSQRDGAVLAYQRAFSRYSTLVDRFSPATAASRDAIAKGAAALIAGSDSLLALVRKGSPRDAILDGKEVLENLEVAYLARVETALNQERREYRRREEALRNRITDTRHIAWWGLTLVTIAIALLGLLMTRRITTPLREMTGATGRVGQGDLDVRVSHAGNDELGLLAQAFNRMAESLKSNVDQRQNAEARLHEAQKLKAIGQLTGGVSHDFNNILAIIMGNAQLIREKNPAFCRKEIDAIDRAAARGSELTQRLLAYSRRQPLASRSVDLAELVTDMKDLLRHSLGGTIAIQTRWAPDLWPVRADPRQIETALVNLALNARHAMPEGGTFSISCTNTHLEAGGPEQDPEFAPGDYVAIRASDTGSGMPAEVARQAFEPFFTTKDFGSGSGLGLSMVYGFVKQTGGNVTLESEERGGTTITMFLPRADQPADRESPRPPPAAPHGRGQKILVLEDEQTVLDMVQSMLEGLGYDVRGALTVDAAREVLKTGKVDLVLSDVVLGGDMSGPEFIVQARERHPDLKAVFMSGFVADQAGGGTGIGHGEVLIRKPFQRHDLAATLHRALN